jgi:hypothetical protein
VQGPLEQNNVGLVDVLTVVPCVLGVDGDRLVLWTAWVRVWWWRGVMVNGAVVLVVGGDRAGGMRLSSRGREKREVWVMVNGAVVLVGGGDRAGGMRLSSRGRESKREVLVRRWLSQLRVVGAVFIGFKYSFHLVESIVFVTRSHTLADKCKWK